VSLRTPGRTSKVVKAQPSNELPCAMSITALLTFAAAAAYTLEPFSVKSTQNTYTLQSVAKTKTKAAGGAYDKAAKTHWVPQTLDDTSEALNAHQRFAKDRKASLEFVHVHKCGGTTFNRVAPTFVCAADACGCNGRWNVSKCAPPCCVVRPRAPSLYELTKRPRYGSALEEQDAFRLPWGTHIFKAAMVREPFARYRSEVGYECSAKRAGPPPSYEEALRRPAWRGRARRNRIAQGLVHPSVLGKEGGSGEGFSGVRFEVMTNGLRAFAFLGMVEAYDASLCLLARTLASDKVCGACCRHERRMPVANANTNASCAAPAAPGDAHLYAATHGADRQVYDAAARIFGARWDRARREGWGATPAECGCVFVAGPGDTMPASAALVSAAPARDAVPPASASAPLPVEDPGAPPCRRDRFDTYGRCVPAGCASFFYGCNTCATKDGALGCTNRRCATPAAPKCRDAPPRRWPWAAAWVLALALAARAWRPQH